MGTLPAGTTQTTLALTTNEAATCRYSPSAGVPYDAMTQTFATTGGMAHSTPVSGLVDGGSYAFYVRCLDTAANANPDDFAISFTVDLPADTAPPVRSGGQPMGTLPAGTTQTTLALTTNEAATCRYSPSGGVPYDAMTQTFATTGGTAHSTPVSGLVDGSSYAFYVRCLDTAANANPDDFAISFTVDNTPTVDTTPPARSGAQPTGTLPAGTTQTTLALTTNEAATCRYSPSAGVPYDAMTQTFATTGGTAHSTPVSGLADGGSYAFYVRCLDTAANANPDDFAISFTVGSPPADTTPAVRSGGQPTGVLPAGTTQTTLALTTNEAATCRYSPSGGVPYDAMTQTFATTGGTAHSTPVSGLVDGSSYAFYVRCLDTAANANPDDFAISFTVDNTPTVDTTPPARSGAQPTGTLPAGTTQTTLALTTNEAATCRYSPSAGVPYDAMTQTFATTGGTAHSTPVSGLADGGSYAFYVRCLDTAANANPDDFAISFTVDFPADTAPPVRSGGQPMGTLPAGTTQTTLALTTNEVATCRYSPSAGVPYDAMTQTFATTGGTAHSTPVSGLVDGGSYAFYVRCLDAAANANPDDFAISFTVGSPPADTTPAVRSGGQPTGVLPAGTTQTTLALTTNEAATCRYSPSAGVPYDAMTQTFATTGGTAHSTPVSGLADGGSYAFYVRCLDTAANANPDDFAISFTVGSPPADTTPAIRSGGQPTGVLPAGTTQTTLALTTNEAATCRYSPSAGVPYDAMTQTFATTGGTAHSAPVSGLVDGGSYAFYVRCLDAA